MKKIVVICTMIVLVIIAGVTWKFVFNNSSNSSSLNPTASADFYNKYDSLDSSTKIIDISGSELNKKVRGNEEVIVMFGKSTWPYCQEVIGDYDTYSKKTNKKLYYVSLEEEANLEQVQIYDILSVPTFIYFKDGKVADRTDMYDFNNYSSWAEILSDFMLETDK